MIEMDQDYCPKRLQELLDIWAEEKLSEAEDRELQTILSRNKQARKTYLEFTKLVSSLHWSYAESMVELSEKSSPVEIKEVKVSFFWKGLSLAAMLLLSFFVFFIYEIKDETLGDIIFSKEPVFVSDIKEGRIKKGEIHLKSGHISIVLDSGALLELKDHVKVEIISPLRVKLLSGSIKVEAPDSAMGFRLETKASDFVDIGTVFKVSVNENQEAELNVIDGVVIARPNQGEMVVPFGSGESGLIDPVFGEVVAVEFNDNRTDVLKPKQNNQYSPLETGSRVVFLGDRNTDFETYLHMVNQAIHKAERQNAPKIFNAGMTCRLLFEEPEIKDLVLDMKPTHAVIAFGPEISINASIKTQYYMSPEVFEEGIIKLCKRLTESKIEPILLIGYSLYPDDVKIESILKAYNKTLLNLAEENNYRTARADEVYAQYKLIHRQSKIVTGSNAYPTFDGHRILARSVLNSFGYAELDVPKKLEIKQAPGVLKHWEINSTIPENDHLTMEKVQAMDTSTWISLTLPQDPNDKVHQRLVVPFQSYVVQARQLGFAMSINHSWKNKTRGVTEYLSDRKKRAYLNIGGDIKEIWLNGKPLRKSLPSIYDVGRHAGRERIPVELKKGANKIIIEASNSFFVSITDNKDWGLESPN